MPGGIRTSRKYFLLVAGLIGCFVCISLTAREPSLRWVFFVTVIIAGALLFWIWLKITPSLKTVLVLAVTFRLLLAPLLPSLSDDAYRYTWDGVIQHHGINPYELKPSDAQLAFLHEDPVYQQLNSKTYYSVYPPISQLIFFIGSSVYDNGWVASYFLIKAILILFELGALILLSTLLDSRTLLLYAWNPVVVVEMAGQAHTEAVMVFFLILALYFHRQRKGTLVAVAIACAGWVKLYPFLILPLLWHRYGWRAIWPVGLVSGIVLLPYAELYVITHLRESLDLYVKLFEFNAGLYYAVKGIGYLISATDWSKTIGPVFRLILLGSLPIVYWLDYKYRWTLSRSIVVVLALFIVLATTVHPWYFLGLIAMMPFLSKVAWHWHWVSLISMGTYVFYVDGSYWPFVVVGWTGWLLLLCVQKQEYLLQTVQKVRANRKVRLIKTLLSTHDGEITILDVGGGEGYVGKQLREIRAARVGHVDVLPMNKTALGSVVYDGQELPHPNGYVDTAVLYFVLHHAREPLMVLKEALRVARDRVVIVESVYQDTWDLRLLTFLDKRANRLRSKGAMREQEEHLQFRKRGEWVDVFRSLNAKVLDERRRGRWLHKQAIFVLEKAHDKAVIAK